jgi:glucose uptake protein
MVFPTTYLGSLLLLIVSLVCAGSWAVTQKLTVKWRYELFYLDVTFGFAITAVAAAFTLGSMNPEELTFQDNFLLTGYRKMAWAVVAGGTFNLGAILLLASMSLSRMSVAFPIALGISLTTGSIWEVAAGLPGRVVLILPGATLVVAAVVLSALAFRWFLEDAQTAAPAGAPRVPAKGGPTASIVLAVIGGVLLGASGNMVGEAMSGENGISAYGVMLLAAASVFGSSLLYVPFLLNFPVQGAPIQVRQYFKGTQKQHLLGLFAGILLATGMLSRMVASSGTPSVRVDPALSYGLNGGAATVAVLWGLLVWREFQGATSRVQMMLLSGIVLFLAGVAVAAFGHAAT